MQDIHLFLPQEAPQSARQQQGEGRFFTDRPGIVAGAAAAKLSGQRTAAGDDQRPMTAARQFGSHLDGPAFDPACVQGR